MSFLWGNADFVESFLEVERWIVMIWVYIGIELEGIKGAISDAFVFLLVEPRVIKNLTHTKLLAQPESWLLDQYLPDKVLEGIWMWLLHLVWEFDLPFSDISLQDLPAISSKRRHSEHELIGDTSNGEPIWYFTVVLLFNDFWGAVLPVFTCTIFPHTLFATWFYCLGEVNEFKVEMLIED